MLHLTAKSSYVSKMYWSSSIRLLTPRNTSPDLFCNTNNKQYFSEIEYFCFLV